MEQLFLVVSRLEAPGPGPEWARGRPSGADQLAGRDTRQRLAGLARSLVR